MNKRQLNKLTKLELVLGVTTVAEKNALKCIFEMDLKREILVVGYREIKTGSYSLKGFVWIDIVTNVSTYGFSVRVDKLENEDFTDLKEKIK